MLIAIIIIGLFTVINIVFLALLVHNAARHAATLYKHVAELHSSVIQNRIIINQILKAAHLHSRSNDETIH